jgi:hypothetical protein
MHRGCASFFKKIDAPAAKPEGVAHPRVVMGLSERRPRFIVGADCKTIG